MKVKVGHVETKLDTIDDFVKHTLDGGRLGCDKTFIRTNMFCMDESILLPHHWGNYTEDRFRDFCKNGNTYLQDPVNLPLMFTWKLLYNRYRAYMFSKHDASVRNTRTSIIYARIKDDNPGIVICETEFIYGFVSGEHDTFITDFFVIKEDK